jgi:hypothetical protein
MRDHFYDRHIDDGMRHGELLLSREERWQPLQPKLAIVINLDHLRQRMAQFVAEVSPHDPTAYTIPFETYLQWEQRQQQENTNAKK